MALYLKVENNVVTDSIIADKAFIDAGYAGDQSLWFESDKGGIRWIYYPDTKTFMPPKPEGTWVFDESSYTWERPTARPDDGKYYEWDEQAQSWKFI